MEFNLCLIYSSLLRSW